MFVNMYTKGMGQCIVTHDKTEVHLYIVLCIFTLFSGSFKSTTLMMRGHTEYNGNAHTRDESVYGHA